MVKKAIPKKLFLLAALVIGVLVVVNILIFSGYLQRQGVACYKDACIYGVKDPVQEFNDLINSSNKVIIAAEGDVNQTQTTAYISAAFAQLSQDFGLKKPMLVGIGFEGGSAVICSCEDYTDGNFTKCVDNSVSYCQNIQPNATSFLIYIKYPNFKKDEIILNGRTIEIRGKSGVDVWALVYLLRDLRR